MIKKIIFVLFFLSGFCALLYQTIWLRLAFAAFGINAQVISVVVSMFMAGLVLGAWLCGRVILAWARRREISSLNLYALAELGVGVGALVVPHLFDLGHSWLLSLGQTNSVLYLFWSALALGISILPWCFFMGTTIPLMMDYVGGLRTDKNIFSYLYLANTLGAMVGVAVTAAVLIEVFGFRTTLLLASVINFLIAATSSALAGRGPAHAAAPIENIRQKL